jgi:hypothetical protein
MASNTAVQPDKDASYWNMDPKHVCQTEEEAQACVKQFCEEYTVDINEVIDIIYGVDDRIAAQCLQLVRRPRRALRARCVACVAANHSPPGCQLGPARAPCSAPWGRARGGGTGRQANTG